MSGLINIKNSIRNFCRKNDEYVMPLLKLIWTLTVFVTIRILFGYSGLMDKPVVIVLMAILTAVLPDGFLFFMVGVVIAVHSFSVSLESGAVFIVLFILIYCFYVRFFPKYAYAVMLLLVCYLFHLEYAAPIIIGLVAGIGGVVPAACGVVLYYFADALRTVNSLATSSAEADQLKAIETLANTFLNNKEMYSAIVTAAITVLVIGIIKKLSFDYSVYAAIGVGALANILAAILSGFIFSINVNLPAIAVGSLIGVAAALLVRLGMGVLDYKHTEHVEYEDDDYYYYVKAIPKDNCENID